MLRLRSSIPFLFFVACCLMQMHMTAVRNMAHAFVPIVISTTPTNTFASSSSSTPSSCFTNSCLRMSSDEPPLSVEDTRERIQTLVDEHPVLLFMKGSKLFPQCGFSNTATQILESYKIDFHTVDVLADEAIRSGIKEYSQWPTIPQLYVCGEFVGGSDIMIELYQSGELGEMIEKAKADMV